MNARFGQGGFAFIELLVAMTIMLLVSGAVLTAFEVFGKVADRNAKLTQAQDATRTVVDAMARSLRNAKSVSRSDYDVRFQTDRPDFGVPPSATGYKARYCLDEASRQLWLQVGAAGGSDPGSACPDTAWGTSTRVIASRVANRLNGQNRPLFPEPTGGRSAQGGLRVDLWLSPDPGRSAQEVHLESAVFVRSLSETAPNVGEGGIRFECPDSGGGVLVLDVPVDPSGNPLIMTVLETLPDGTVTVIGVGNEVHLSAGNHPNLMVKITNVLGLEQVIFKDVSCP
jgi:type II secretory pathway pseudopilin PulG